MNDLHVHINNITCAKDMAPAFSTSYFLFLKMDPPTTNATEFRSVVHALQHLALTRSDITNLVNKLS